MSKERRTITRLVLTLVVTGFLASVAIFTGIPAAKAHIVPFPCDFTTGGGFVITDNGYHANFGLVGGCKHDGFFGHVNFVDHDETGEYAAPFTGISAVKVRRRRRRRGSSTIRRVPEPSWKHVRLPRGRPW